MPRITNYIYQNIACMFGVDIIYLRPPSITTQPRLGNAPDATMRLINAGVQNRNVLQTYLCHNAKTIHHDIIYVGKPGGPSTSPSSARSPGKLKLTTIEINREVRPMLSSAAVHYQTVLWRRGRQNQFVRDQRNPIYITVNFSC